MLKINNLNANIDKKSILKGFSLNVNTDLSFYDGIIPCGIFDRGVTSMEKVLKRTQEMEKVKSLVIDKFNQILIKSNLKWQD